MAERPEEIAPTVSFEDLVRNSHLELQTPYGLQDGNGIDLTLVYENLKRPPGERLRRSDAMARAIFRLRQNVKRIA